MSASPLLIAQGVELSFNDKLVLRGCDLAVSTGERIGLVGINGSGKSTLLRVISGQLSPDHGSVVMQRREGSRGGFGLLEQDPRLPGRTVGEALDEALAWHSALLADYEAAMATSPERAAALQDELDRVGWTLQHEVEALATHLQCPPRSTEVEKLSGGERRRVALARVLLARPELLLLDEPTNHLDADTIEWLQGWLLNWRGALLLVTHDRYLLEALAQRIVEIDDGETVAYEGSYTDYLVARAERQARLRQAEDRRLALIAREAEWASRSPAAQTTKQKARLQRLDALLAVRPLRREETFALELQSSLSKSGPLVELRGVSKAYGPRRLLHRLDLTVRPGDRIGIIGPNGAGKSTLLHIIAGTLAPDQGELVRAPRVVPHLLDQARSGLDPKKTVFETAGGGNDHVTVGDRSVHVVNFLARFLFQRTALDQPVATLSGGERARLLMARMLLQGASLLLLDEPTNDLDLVTLGVLEEALLSFDGAVLVVSHDRAFVDRACNQVLAFEGEAQVAPYADRLQHLAALRARESAAQTRRAEEQARAARAAPPPAAPRSRKGLSWKEQQELAQLPGRIEALEQEQGQVNEALAAPGAWTDRGKASALQARAQAIAEEIDRTFTRWSELEERARG